METSGQTDDPVLRSLRDHVLGPVSTAEAIVERERAEVDAERRAFERFGQRVAGIEPEPAARAGPDRPSTLADPGTDRTERLRSAFRESVMSVDHYGRYDESLVEFVAADLSADVATGFRRDAATRFTAFYKTALTSAVDAAVDVRATLCDQLDEEAASLETSRASLVGLLDRCEGPGTAGHRAVCGSELDDLTRDRQALVQRRDPASGTDGHDLCEYVYGNAEWTYPVLTAATRFRTAVG